MILELKNDVNKAQIQAISEFLSQKGFPHYCLERYGKSILLFPKTVDYGLVETIIPNDLIVNKYTISTQFKLASKEWKEQATVINFSNGLSFGGDDFPIIAGPCSVESEEQIFTIAENLSALGIKFLRGGAYKPRTSPYDFQGLGNDGLKLIRKAADKFGMMVVTEVLDTTLIEEVTEYADILQIGSRNMQNYYFLKQLGKVNKPILLKRGMYSKIEEWLLAAEYILLAGNENIILCERGIRTFDTSLRNTMDISAIPLVKELSHLPIIADPSHGTGKIGLINKLSMASLVAGADGLLVEVHQNPKNALSDGNQSLNLNEFQNLITQLAPIAKTVNRNLNLDINTFNSESIK